MRQATITAMPTNRTIAAAVCPDGKLDVAGVELRRGTSGRGRSTTKVTERNTVISRNSAIVRKAASRQCLRSASKPTTTAATTTTGSVLTAAVATFVMSFQPLVRCRAKCSLTCRSQLPTVPSNACVSKKPMPSISAASTTYPMNVTMRADRNGCCGERSSARASEVGSSTEPSVFAIGTSGEMYSRMCRRVKVVGQSPALGR